MKARLPDGYGKQNMNVLMKQAQDMQNQMQAKQDELREEETTATSGGDMVSLTMRGDFTVTSVHINPELVSGDDIEMLEDLIGAAFNEGVRQINEKADREMETISGAFPGLAGLGL